MQRTLTLVVGLSVVLSLLLAACAPAAAPTPQPAPQTTTPAPAPRTAAPQAPAVPAKAAWETEWEQTMEAAKKEGTLVFYTTVADYRMAMAVAMKKYGISLESIIVSGSSGPAKLFAERRAGIYSADIYGSGTTTIVATLKPSGVLTPMEPMLILPDVKDPKMWWNDTFPWIDNEHYMVAPLGEVRADITVNTNVVKPGEIQGWRDLLDPKWKEKIIIQDPSISGGGQQWFANNQMGGILDENYMRQLAEQKPVITRDRRLQVEWVAHGKMALAIAAQSATITSFVKVGAPLQRVVPKEGTWLTTTSGAFALISKPAHPNAARFFANWNLSKEGQTVVSQTIGSESRRLNVPTDHLNPDILRKPGVKYFVVDTEETIEKIPRYNQRAAEIFGIK